MWLIRCELSHTGSPCRMSALGLRLLMPHFLLHNRSHCQPGTCSLIVFIIAVTYCLAARDAGFLRATGFFFNSSVHCSSPSKSFCTLCTDVASQRELSIFAFRAVRKIHPTVPVPVHAALFGNPPPIMPFQCYPVNPPLPSNFPLEPMPRGLRG